MGCVVSIIAVVSFPLGKGSREREKAGPASFG
jgi:hypothetical protein